MLIFTVIFALISGGSGAAIIIRRMIKGELPWIGNTLTPSIYVKIDTADWILFVTFIIFLVLFVISSVVT